MKDCDKNKESLYIQYWNILYSVYMDGQCRKNFQ